MIENDQKTTVEWVLIALLSVFGIYSALQVGLFLGVVTIQAGIPIMSVISDGMLMSSVVGTAYWLVAVAALWFVAHRLGFRQWWALAAIAAAVSAALSIILGGGHYSLVWFVLNTAISSFMGWILWRLAYRKPAAVAGTGIGPVSYQYQTTIGQALFALACGSLSGTALSMAILLALFGLAYAGEIVEIFSYALAFWSMGTFALGGTSLVALHFIGLRHWYGMTVVGGVVLLVIGLVVFDEMPDPAYILAIIAVGCVVGWVIWRVAYRRTPMEG